MIKHVEVTNKNVSNSDLNEKNEEETVWPQILAILAGGLGAFTDGVIFSWTSPFIVKIVQNKVDYDISEEEAANFPIIQPVALIITGLLISNLCDVIGRKKVLLFLAVPHVINLLLSAFARHVYVFYAARVCAGIGDAFLWSALPMYTGEVASPKVRGVWGNTLASGLYMGQFAINVVGSYCDIPTTSYIFLPLPILFFIIFIFMPESPYYYLMKKDYEAAKCSLKFLTRKSNVDPEFNQLKHDVERQLSESGTWKDLVSIPSNRKALLAGFFLRWSQQFCGIPVFNQYTQFIFQKAGGLVSPRIASMIFSALCLILNIIVVTFVVDKFSRKRLYASSLVPCSVVLFIISIYFYLDQMMPSVDTASLSWLPITALVSYQVVTSFGVTVIPTLMLGELFSSSVKAKGLTVLMIAMAAGVFMTNSIFNLLNTSVGYYGPFLLFGICTVLSSLSSFFVIPDTKGKTLEEIQMTLKTAE
ncbi:facilitated trehalose transporter Tret1-like [Diabrotica undecimpunctata]|uniref:facilitated trehalose transporter Tret1-like n=1 Tax=Diabrotica undecimpunctata TaxID=50387 RepID=UPI003B631B2B